MKLKNIAVVCNITFNIDTERICEIEIDQKKFSRSKENTKYWKIFYDEGL